MKKYKIYVSGLREMTSIGHVPSGFPVVQVHSEAQALLVPHTTSAESFQAALTEAGISAYSEFKENEPYHGYIAVWKRWCVQTYYVEGHLKSATKEDAVGVLDYNVRELCAKGELIVGIYNAYNCNVPLNEDIYEGFPNLRQRVIDAVESGSYELLMSDEEKKHLDCWPCFKNSLALL